jgi:CBS-domain-containing membrane protein
VVGLVSKCDYLANFVFTPAHIIPHYRGYGEPNRRGRHDTDIRLCQGRNEIDESATADDRSSTQEMPVIRSDQRLAGMISREDVMRALQRCSGVNAIA